MILHKGDGIDGSKMMIVLLRNLSRLAVIGNNFVVGTSHHERIVVVRVKLDNVGNTTIGVGAKNLAGFRIPKPNEPIERGRKEGRSIVAELHIPHGRRMPNIRSHHLLLSDRPNLALALQTSTQQQMTGAGEEPNPMYALVVTGKSARALLRHKALMILHIVGFGRIGTGGRDRPGPTAVVQLGLSMEDGAGLDGLRILSLHPRGKQMRHLPLDEAVELLRLVGLGILGVLSATAIPLGNVRTLGHLLLRQLDAAGQVRYLVVLHGPLLGRRWAPDPIRRLVVGPLHQLLEFGILRLF